MTMKSWQDTRISLNSLNLLEGKHRAGFSHWGESAEPCSAWGTAVPLYSNPHVLWGRKRWGCSKFHLSVCQCRSGQRGSRGITVMLTGQHRCQHRALQCLLWFQKWRRKRGQGWFVFGWAALTKMWHLWKEFAKLKKLNLSVWRIRHA